MRIITILSYTLIALLGFNSCGGDTSSSKPNSSDKVAASEKPVPTFVMKSEDGVKPNNANNQIKKQQKPESKSVEGSLTNNTKSNQDQATQAQTDGQKLNSVPNACSLISVSQIAQILGVQPEAIAQKDASHTKSPYTRSCFFRWDGASPNTGILLQVQANPVAEEYAEWVSLKDLEMMVHFHID